jgi:hypothetical protein
VSRPANGRYDIANIYGEVIPAIPDARSAPYMGREPVVSFKEHRHEPGNKIQMRFDERRGEMRLICGCCLPSKAAFDYWLAEVRQLYGKENVKQVALWVCQENVRENFAMFKARGYERHEARDCYGLFVLAKSPATQW